MQNNIFKKWLVLGTIFLMISLIFGSSTNAIRNKQVFDTLDENTIVQNLADSYTDITAEEAWDLLNDTSNGIQIPIDVRTDSEWKDEHIDTPSPEHPRHNNFYEWDDEFILLDFMLLFDGEEIIVYCRSGSRSVSAINILIDYGFNGTIYNMLGGITSWKNSGLPTVGNRPPEKPLIGGTLNGKAGNSYEYTLSALDQDYDKIYYVINWSDGTDELYLGPYPSNEEVTVKHTWEERGTYVIKTQSKDPYDAESEWATLEINMPKPKTYAYTTIIRFLQNLTNLLPMIRQLL